MTALDIGVFLLIGFVVGYVAGIVRASKAFRGAIIHMEPGSKITITRSHEYDGCP